MIIKPIIREVYRNLINIPGWRTKKHIVVIESDDWGAIRMPSKYVYNEFIKKNFKVDKGEYNRLDSLESNDDLTALYDVLASVKDVQGNYAAFTANCVVANPDFIKIKDSGYSKYYYEPVSLTLKRYPKRDKVEALWMDGIKNNLFHPQSHGREHLNVKRWMNALQTGSTEILFTFAHNTTYSGTGDYSFMGALDFDHTNEITDQKKILFEGLRLFAYTFGYVSKSFIAPCYVWDNKLNYILAQSGVKYIQGGVTQYIPTGGFRKYSKRYHYIGEKNISGQKYLIRNCSFEPALRFAVDEVSSTLQQVEIAFRYHKPAVICSHRVNYIGSLDENNRKTNLLSLRDLLCKILRLWPDVEFMTSDALGDLIQ